MLRTILSRLGRALSVGFWVMVISFSIMRIIPGDPAAARLGGVEQDAIEVLRKELNLDGSIMQQFSTYIVGLLKGDLGVSLQTGRSVTDIIGSTLPLTVYLIIFSTFLHSSYLYLLEQQSRGQVELQSFIHLGLSLP